MRIKDGVLYACDKDINVNGSFIVPNNVKRIGGYAFWNCHQLKSVYIPDSVKSIGKAAFEGCTQLASVTLGNSIMKIEARAFSHCFKLTSVTIPDSVKSIGYDAFLRCTELSSVTIPDGVEKIGGYAFNGCTSLTSVTIGNGVTNIGAGAFYGCTQLTFIAIGNSIKSIGEGAFFDCSKLASKTANYKAFALTKKGGLLCRHKTYSVGEKSTVEGELKLCHNGIHYCTNMFDIFTYYDGEYGKDFVVGICEVSDETIGVDRDSKHCARWIIPTKILTREEVIGIMNGEDTE